MKPLCLLTLPLLVIAARGQYSLSSSHHAAGGGTLQGGGYTLRASIGQPLATAEASAGTEHKALAGFWAWEGEDAPLMEVSLTATHAVLSWPYLLPDDVRLESTSDLSLWTELPAPGFSLADPLTATRRLYRLRIE
jgi:hypothetical protein